MFRVAGSAVRGELDVTPGSDGGDRPTVALAIYKAGHFFLPAVLVGIILGVLTWVDQRVSFHRPVDERVARIFLGWVVAPLCFTIVTGWSESLEANALFGTGSLGMILVPYVPFTAFAVLGIRSGRAVRSQEPSSSEATEANG